MVDFQGNGDEYTVSGTNIEEVKRNNAQSGLTYNEVKQLLAKTTGTKDEGSYSQAEIAAAKKKYE